MSLQAAPRPLGSEPQPCRPLKVGGGVPWVFSLQTHTPDSQGLAQCQERGSEESSSEEGGVDALFLPYG